MLRTAEISLVGLALLPGFAKGETTNLGEYGPFNKIEFLTGTPDGSVWGFRAKKPDGKWYVIINGKEWGPYEVAGDPEFSSDGSSWGFEAKKPGGNWYVIINGKEWGPYEVAWWPRFSLDGSAAFYAATQTEPSYYRIERIRVPTK